MSSSRSWKLRRVGRKFLQILVCVLLAAQSVYFSSSAKAESESSSFYFRGFSTENITTNTFAYAISGATLDGTTVRMTSASGTAVGYIALDEIGHNISTSVDLGDLEISFSVVTNVTAEGTAGDANDVPTVEIYFCTEADPDAVIGSPVTLQKADTTVSGNVTLSSHASIPSGTRGIFIYLTGTSTSGDNTVVFSSPTLKINDAAPPTCDVSYNTDWTNGNVTVTVTAADGDSGLEGIYVNGTKVTATSPYVTTATTSGTQYVAYSKDYAGKVSATVDKTVNNIDKVTPATPTSATLSTDAWTNQDVTLNLPALSWGSAAPEFFIYQIGTGSWQTLPDGFTLTESGRYTLRLAVKDAAGNTSGSVERYAQIDKIVPTIDNITKTSGVGSCRVDVTYSDGGLSGLNLVRYAQGDADAETVLASGTDITGGTFTVTAGGAYTICVSDHAGNVARSVVTLSTKPTLTSIADTSTDEDTPLEVTLDVSDAETGIVALTIEASSSDTNLIGSIDIIQSATGASLMIHPAAEQHGGPAVITVTVTDADGETATDQFNLTVNSVNDLPIAQDDSGITLDEDTHVKINVLENDSDLADGDTLTIDSVTAPAHGTAVIVLGQIKYTPNENYVGDDTFSYTVSDGNGGTDTADVFVTVTNINDAPTALPDEATCAEDSFVYIDVLSNDSDIDVNSAVESISLLSCENGANGTAEVKDGKILYTPDGNFYGEDSFTYTLQDSTGAPATAVVKVKVTAVPDDPVFVGLDAEYTVDEDSVNAAITFEISDVETPANSVMLQASSPESAVDLLPNENISVSGLGDDSDTVSVLVTPMANQTGDVTLTLTLGDGFTTVTQTILVHITDVNDAPTAKADSISYDEDAETVSISLSALLGNDTDLDGDTLTFDGVVSTTTIGTLETVGDPVTGLIYTPLADYEGTDSFTYRVSDGTATSIGTCTLTARAANDSPTIEFVESSYSVDEDTEITGIRVRIADKETAAGSLLVIGSSDNGALVPTDNITIVNNGDGTADISILPAADANGTVNIIITVSDGAASAYASVLLTVAPKPDAPVAAADNIYVPLSGKRVFSTLTNDHDVDGDTLTITGFDDSTLNGTLLYDEETKLFTYYSAIGEVGTGTFTYTLSDGALTSTGTVTLHINSIAHAPSISAISDQAVEEDQTISGISFLVEDDDYGDEITISVASSDDTVLKVDESSVVVTDNGDGSYSLFLKPVANASGNITITVTATDLASLHTSSSFTLRVLPQNDAPIAVADEISLNEDSAKTLNLTGNDSDPDGDTFWVNYVSWPANGYLVRSGTTYTYYPYYNWNGTETLTYQITDGRAYATATAVITVDPVNDAPVARDDYRTLENSTGTESANINVLANDYDPEGETVYLLQIVSQPSYGKVSFEGGVVTYTRTSVSPNDNGADSFTYRIIDRSSAEGDYLSDEATVHIGLVFHSSLYTYGRSYYCMEDSAPADIDLPIYNPNNVEYSLSLSETDTALGTLTIVDHDTVNFAPAANASGSITLQYTVTQNGGSETSWNYLYLHVYPVNDPPVIDSAPASASCEEDSETGATFDVTFHDPDCAQSALYFYAYTSYAETGATVPFEVQTQVTRTTTGATVTVLPMENVNGTADLIIGVSDGMIAAERTIKLTVTPVDDAPGVNQLNATTYEDVSVKINVLRSNSEVDGDAVTLAVLEGDGPDHGEVEVLSGGIIVYHPDADFYGDDTFTYTITDQTTAKLSASQTATIHVVAVNDQPEIKDLDYYQTTNEDTPAEVLLTVHDVDNDLSSSTHYTLTSDNETLIKSISIVRVSGEQMKITVVPNDNAYGTALISIVASDGELTAEGAFQLKVISVNDPPVAVDDAKTIYEAVSEPADTTPRKTTTTMELTANDTDVEDATLKIVKIENVSYGTVTNNGNGTVTVSANGDYSGDITFDYTVMDKNGASASASVTLTITPQNDPPNAVADSKTINEDNSISIDVLGNDTDVENDTLSVESYAAPAHGAVVRDGSNLLYTPSTNYNGTDSFTYTVSDGQGGTDTATVTIKIKPVNDAPEIAKHSTTSGDWTMDEDSTAPFNFVVSDPETQASNLLITIHSENSTILLTPQIKLTTNAAGYKTITVRSNPDAYGVVPVHFVVSDGQLTTEATYNITINGVNDAPVAVDQTQTMKEDGVLSSVLTATDVENNTLTYTLETAPFNGTAVVNADGTYTYTPNADWNGTDTFVFRVDDGQSENRYDLGTVTVIVKPENDPPTAIYDTASTDEDTAVTINVLANDTDSDLPDDTLTVASVTHPAKGSAVISEGKILYTPNANINGTDTFSYTVSDQDGKTDSAIVSVTIAAVNDTPSGGDDTATVEEDHSVTIPAAANDDIDETTNPSVEDVKVTRVDDPAHGTASITNGGKDILYTPDANWFGTEIFTYTAEDSGTPALTAEFTITVTVTPVNDAPEIRVAEPLTELPDVTTFEDVVTSPITFTVYDEEDAESSLTVTITRGNTTLVPALTVTPGADGSCSFTILPNQNKNGTSTITVTVKDSENATDTDTFNLTVTKVNDNPSAQPDYATVNENTAATIFVLNNDDVDTSNEGDTLSIVSVADPQYGSYVISGQSVIYTPDASRDTKVSYTDTFQYTMKDLAGVITSSANIVVTVTPVNDAPVISAIDDISNIAEDAEGGTGLIPFTVTDEEDADSSLVVTATSSNTTLVPLANILISSPSDNPTGEKRTVQVLPAANKYGTATITLTVTDTGPGVRSTSESFTITVNSVNDTPANGNDSYTVTEDVEQELLVLANDDVDGANSLTVTDITTLPTKGTVRIAEDGKSVFYKTNLNSNAADSFVYKGHDAYGGTDYEFTVNITVTPVNDAPVITYGGLTSYTVNETVPQNGIPFTVNDVDNNCDVDNGQPVTVTVTAKSSNSLLLKNGITITAPSGVNRELNLQPYLKWNGTTTVTITAKDSGGLTATQELTFNVNSVNDAPVAYNDTFSIDEDETTTLDVLYNDRDEELLTNPGQEEIFVNSVTDTDPNAEITASADNKSVQIVPLGDYNGPVTFTYTIHDLLNATSNVATVTVNIQPVNDAPVPDDETVTTAEGTPITIDVLDGDTDIDQDATLNADHGAEVLSVSIAEEDLAAPAHGSIEIVDGKIKYTPAGDYNGPDTFEYNCSDGDVLVTANVYVTVTQVNDNPVAVADTVTTDEDRTADAVAVLDNDTDVDTDEATNANALHLSSTFDVTDAVVETAGSGTVELKADNTLVFDPAGDWFGIATVRYTMVDGNGGTADGYLYVTVNSVNDLPQFADGPDTMNLTEDGSNGEDAFTVSDVETPAGDLLVEYVGSGNTGLVDSSCVTLTKGTSGALTVTVNPKLDQNGSAEITLKVKDGDSGETTIKFTVYVTAVNDSPTAIDKSLTIAEDSNTQTILKSALVSDVDVETNGDVLTLTVDPGTIKGTAAVTGGNITYKPLANWNGTESFTYTVTDSGGLTATKTITFTVTQVNDSPVPDADSATTDEGTAVTIDVLDGDTDIDQDVTLNATPGAEVLSVTLLGGTLVAPAHGTVSVVSNKIVYTPTGDYNGTDSFEYFCYDGDVRVKATVSVTINQVNDNPVAFADIVTTNEDTNSTPVNVLSNDTDVDTNTSINKALPLHLLSELYVDGTSVSPEASGTVAFTAPGTLVFKPAANWFGTATVTYTLKDGHGGQTTGTLTVTVNSVNDLPQFADGPDTMNLTEDGSNGVDAFTVSDVETPAGDLLVEYVGSGNTGLVDSSCVTLTKGTSGAWTVTVNPKENQNGSAEITLKVKDGDSGETTIKFTVNVTAVNDNPTAIDKNYMIAEDSSTQTILKSALVSDVDVETNGDVLTLTVDPGTIKGAVAVVGGNITYKPLANWNGTESFTYTVTDFEGLTATKTISYTVTQVNDAPTPDADSATTDEGTTVTIDVLDGDTDIDQDVTLNVTPGAEVLSVTLSGGTLVAPAHGSVLVVNNKIGYTPTGDFNGTDSFEYFCYDGDVRVKATVTVTVNQVNDNPVAVADTVTTNEDTDSTPVNVLSNDTDVDTNTSINIALPLHLLSELYVDGTSVSPEASGTVAFTAPGTLVFKPAANWFGTAAVTYTLKDGHGGQTTGTLTVTVNSVNDLPQFADGPSDMNLTEDGTNGEDAFTVSDVETAASSLLLEYVGSTNTSLVDSSCVSLVKGMLGAWTVFVNPKDNQNGTAKVTLKVTDGDSGFTTIEFTVNVAAVNDNPTAIDKSLTIAEDSNTQTILKADLVSDVDVDTNADVLTLTVNSGTIKGTAAVTGGNITYKPLANWNGTESFTYTVTDKDGLSDTKTITFTVTQVNDSPVPDADSATTDEGTAVTIDVLDGDTDIDQNATLNATPGAEVLSVSLTGGTLTAPAHGTVAVVSNKIVYTPTGDYNGTDTFQYNCFDGDVNVAASVTVTIKQVNDTPNAVADSAETPDETPVSVDVLANDTDIDTDETLNKDELHSKSSFRVTSFYFIDGDTGELSELNGVITYTPELNFVGTQKIGYVLSDGKGLTDTGILTIAVAAQNDKPVAHDDAMNTEEDKAVTLNLLTNDTDQDPGDTLYFVEFTSSTANLPGTFETNANGSVTFTPSANYHGSFTIDYLMRDAGGLNDTATITVTVSALNDAPTAENGTASTNEDTKKEIDVSSLIADADIATDSDELTVTVAEADEPAHGTVSVSGKVISYTPDANWNGSDSLTFTVADKAGETAKGRIDITVVPVNDAPVANTDAISIDEDAVDTFNVLENDTDVDTDDTLNITPQGTPTLSSVGTALHGTVAIEKGRVQYQPAENYNGPDSFTYTITDGALTSSVTVSVTVKQVNDPVTPVDDTAVTTDEDPVTVDVLANDTDVDTDTTLNKGTLHYKSEYSVTLIGSPSHGTAELVSGKIVYTPEDTYNGADSFSYTMTDGHGSSASATVSVTILSKNDPPETPIVSTPKDGDRAGGSSTVKVEWTCFDIDGDTLTYTLEYYNGKAWVVEKTGLTATTYEFAIPSSVGSTDGLKFRVKAKDSEFTTDYGYSGAMSVDRDAPLSVTVNMKTADGRAYTAGVWTNQTVTVTAVGADDLNPVTFQYAQDGAAYAAAENSVVTTGVHSVYILATDAFDNAAEFGPYLARVDKQPPAVPKIAESLSGANILLTLTFTADPGGSGNDYLILPDGTRTAAKGNPEFAVSRNGTVSFTLYDAAGNKTAFTYTVTSVDTSKPVITCSSGSYSIGSTTQSSISASLSFTDGESELTARGYQLSTSAAPGGSYKNYGGSISITAPGTYYIHAYAKNAFGLTTYETFGPFIVEAVPEATPAPTTAEDTGDVLVDVEDIADDVPQPPVYIRLPGEEWSQTLTLEDVGPGDYLVEAMDSEGNVYTTTVHVTMRDIVARQLRKDGAVWGIAAIAGGLGLAGLFLILLLIGNNVTIRVFGEAVGEEKKLRTMRRIRFRKDKLIIKLENKHVTGGEYATIHVAKHLTKRMRTRMIVITLRGQEVLSELVPEDMNEAFRRKIEL